MQLKYPKILNIYALLITTGFTIITAVQWFAAFFNGGKILITINNYNEMYPELIMWIILLPIIIISVINNYNTVCKDAYKEMK